MSREGDISVGRNTSGKGRGFENISKILDIDFLNSTVGKRREARIEISSIGISDDKRLQLVFDTGEAAGLCIGVCPRWGADNYFVRTDKLAFYIAGEASPVSKLSEFLVRYVGKKLSRLSFDTLVNLCRLDGLEYLGRFAGDEERAYYGWDGQWRTFLCPGVYEVNTYSTLSIASPKLVLSVMDNVCGCSYLPMSPNLARFHNYPGVGKTTAYQKNCLRHQVVELSENDLIFGTRGKVEEGLRKLRADADGADLLYINSTCVCHVTGENYEDIGRAAREEFGMPVFFDGPNINNEPEIHSRKLWDIYNSKKRGAKPAGAGISANLVGFPDGDSSSELAGMLREAGINVSSKIYPTVDIDDFEAVVDADINVLYPCEFFQRLAGEMFAKTGIPSISPPAPYGMGGTARWLARVCEAVNIEYPAARLDDKYFAPLAEKHEARKRAAAGHALAFAADRAEIDMLLNGDGYWGVRLFETLGEMGFGIDILLYQRGGEGDEAQILEQVAAASGRPGSVRVKTFGDAAGLKGLLAGDDFDAVFSDFFFDHRISSNGKAQFSLKTFEPGARGAIRTADRLLEICKLPFYREFGRYLPERLLR